MKKLFTNLNLRAVLAPFIILLFFAPNVLQGKVPIPADSLLGLYHPWRDQTFGGYAAGKFPVKNPLITDPILQSFPWLKIVVENYKRGNLPLWNPYSFSGQPLLANIQSSPFQIINIFFLILPFKTGWVIQVILPLILTAIFMYLFLRSLKLSTVAASFGALVLSYSGFFVAWFTWGTIVATAMWLPLILFCTNKLFEKISPFFFLLLTISIFQVIVSGHWQTAFYVLLAFFIYSIFLSTKTRKLQHLSAVIIALILGLLISAPQTLPSLEFINLSNREVDQGFAEGKKDWFLPYQHLIQIVAPDFFGNPTTYNYWGVWNWAEFVGFTGIIPLIFATFGLIPQNRNKLFFVIIALISLLFALENPISKIPYTLNLPLISSMQPSRIIFLLVFSLASFSAIGLEFILKSKFKKRFLYSPIVVVSLVTTLFLATKLGGKFFPAVGNLDSASIAARNLIFPFGIALIGLILFCSLLLKLPKKIIVILFFLVTIVDLFRFADKFTPFSKTSDVFPPTEVTNFLSQQQRPFRIMATDRRIFHPNTSSVYNIESTQGYDPLYLKKYAKLVSTWESQKLSEAGSFNRIVTPQKYDSQIADLLNVKYFLSFDEISNPKLVKVFEKGETKIYENKEVLPRAFFVENVKKVENEDKELESLLDVNFGLKESAVSSTLKYDGAANHTEVSFDNYSDQSMVLSVATQQEAPLVTSTVFYPGWSAYVDSRKQEIEKVNFMFQAVLVPEGRHKVEFKYEPKSVYNGFRLAGIGVFLTLLATIYLWRKRYQ